LTLERLLFHALNTIYLFNTNNYFSLSLSFSLTVSINVDEFYDLLTISVQLYSLLKIRRRLEEKNKLNWDKSSSTLMEMGITLSLSLFLSLSLSLFLFFFFVRCFASTVSHTYFARNERVTDISLSVQRARQKWLIAEDNEPRKEMKWVNEAMNGPSYEWIYYHAAALRVVARMTTTMTLFPSFLLLSR